MSYSFEEQQEIRFTVVKGANAGAVVRFTPGARSIRIGRAVDNDIVIGDPTVSRTHARVDLREEGCVIADAGGRTGVVKMGFPLGPNPEPLESGDEFKIGDTILRFEVVLKKGAVKRAKASSEAGQKKQAAAARARDVGGALDRMLSAMGLRTATLRILAGAVVAILLVVVLWPKPPGIPPQSGEPLPINYTAVVGFAEGGDQSHLDLARFRVPTDAEGVGIYLKTLAPAGLGIRAGTLNVATVEGDPSWRSYQLLVMPRAISREGTSLVEIDNLGWPPAEGPQTLAAAQPWLLAKMWVARVRSGAALPARLADETRVIGELSKKLDEEPEYLYQALDGLRGVAVGFMKLSGRAAVLVSIPSVVKGRDVSELVAGALREIEANRLNQGLDLIIEAMAVLEAELERRFQENMNAVTVLKRRLENRKAAEILSIAIRQVPDPTDPRHREIREEVGKLDTGSRNIFEEALRRSKL
jgi:uncharacterized protein YqgV (UPF0045/DUF77 family)